MKHPESDHPFVDPNDPSSLLMQKLEARQEAHFERLKGDLTEWLGYMHAEQQRSLKDGLEQIRRERQESEERVLTRLDEVLASMKSLAESARAGQTGA